MILRRTVNLVQRFVYHTIDKVHIEVYHRTTWWLLGIPVLRYDALHTHNL
jgi:hypothetical protein